MCTVACPLCDRLVPFEPGSDRFACAACAVACAVVDPEPEADALPLAA